MKWVENQHFRLLVGPEGGHLGNQLGVLDHHDAQVLKAAPLAHLPEGPGKIHLQRPVALGQLAGPRGQVGGETPGRRTTNSSGSPR